MDLSLELDIHSLDFVPKFETATKKARSPNGLRAVFIKLSLGSSQQRYLLIGAKLESNGIR